MFKTIDEVKKEVAKESVEECFEVIFESEISCDDYKQARQLWNKVGDRYIKQFENHENKIRKRNTTMDNK